MRITPAQPPFQPEIAEWFTKLMPAGMEPLALFRVLARNPRVFARMMGAGLLDKGALTMRQRELMILRTTARCACGYEWGVHAAVYAPKAGLTAAEVAATASRSIDGFEGAERLILRLADALHDSAGCDDALWAALSTAYRDEQLLELIALAGYYHQISFVANAARLPAEPFGVAFPGQAP